MRTVQLLEHIAPLSDSEQVTGGKVVAATLTVNILLSLVIAVS